MDKWQQCSLNIIYTGLNSNHVFFCDPTKSERSKGINGLIHCHRKTTGKFKCLTFFTVTWQEKLNLKVLKFSEYALWQFFWYISLKTFTQTLLTDLWHRSQAINFNIKEFHFGNSHMQCEFFPNVLPSRQIWQKVKLSKYEENQTKMYGKKWNNYM
jgi:hypothetical protein